VTTPAGLEDLLRDLAPQVLGILVRRYGGFAECEDAVQDALMSAATQWPAGGVPDHPRSWLVTVASRRLTDQWRSDSARRRREETAALEDVHADVPDRDDTIALLLLCCHSELSPASQVALTLRAVGGLTTAEIASAFLVPEATMAQRISRAKQKIKATGTVFAIPGPDELPGRMSAVLRVLYLIFNEGYIASAGAALSRTDLTGEAIRIAGQLRRLRPDDGEIAGLYALMVLTDARKSARTTVAGDLIPLAEQDRRQWDRAKISEGIALIERTLKTSPVGPYQVQAAIAAVHAEAVDAADTDWDQILLLYDVLERLSPSPVVTLNRSVAAAMVSGPEAGLAILDRLAADERMASHHRLSAVRGHLYEMAGDRSAARANYIEAAKRTTSLPERRYLESRATRLASP
jgi:RNA polymerase sigma factor (sigma-70 family)